MLPLHYYVRDHPTYRDGTNHPSQSSLMAKPDELKSFMKGCFFCEIPEFSLTMPGPQLRWRSRLGPALPSMTHITPAASTALPASGRSCVIGAAMRSFTPHFAAHHPTGADRVYPLVQIEFKFSAKVCSTV